MKRYRYTGKEKDEWTGLSYHGARYYAPWLGRWCAADPIGLGDGVNRYAYVRNRPIGSHDPSGMGSEGTTVELRQPGDHTVRPQTHGPEDNDFAQTITSGKESWRSREGIQLGLTTWSPAGWGLINDGEDIPSAFTRNTLAMAKGFATNESSAGSYLSSNIGRGLGYVAPIFGHASMDDLRGLSPGQTATWGGRLAAAWTIAEGVSGFRTGWARQGAGLALDSRRGIRAYSGLPFGEFNRVGQYGGVYARRMVDGIRPSTIDNLLDEGADLAADAAWSGGARTSAAVTDTVVELGGEGEIVRRFLNKKAMKNAKKRGIAFDAGAKRPGIDTTTTNIQPIGPDKIKEMTGARNADNFIDIDISGISVIRRKTKAGHHEIVLLEDIDPERIVDTGRVIKSRRSR